MQSLGGAVLILAGSAAGNSPGAPAPLAVRAADSVPPAGASTPLELIVLGSGGPGATGRASSANVVLIDGTPRILVDAGSGAFARLGEAQLPLAQLDTILLTHLHIDHAGELAGLMKARAVSSSGPITFRIFGPDGSPGRGDGAYFPSTRRFLELLFGARGAFAAPITLEAHDFPASLATGGEVRVIAREPDWTVSAIAGHHGDAPAVIY